MRTKDSTVETEFHPVITSFLFGVDAIYRNWGDELVITSGSEHTTKHGVNSLHYAKPACAADIRTWVRAKVPDAKAQLEAITNWAANFCKRAGYPTNWIDVILESDHIHVEFQPKRKL